MNINNVVVISDIHAGCKLGLCPSGLIPLDDGASYSSSKLQQKVWKMWEKFFNEWVPKVTKGEKYVIVNNGDALDGIHHGSVTQITHNLTIQAAIARTILEPVISNKNCIGYYHIRGTEAHVGKSAQNEERLAKELGAIPNEFGQHARWDMWLKLHERLIHFSHHIGATGSSSYESTAVYKEMVEAFNEAGRWNDKPPDVCVRSHRHRQFEIRIATENGYGISFVTPGWQLKTPFVWRLPSGRASTPQIGGYIIRYGNEDDVYTRFKVWKMSRSREVIL
jgi:hypothetical protein